jgi:hypothetical protein
MTWLIIALAALLLALIVVAGIGAIIFYRFFIFMILTFPFGLMLWFDRKKRGQWKN